MNNLLREIKAIEANKKMEEIEKQEHRELIRKRAQNMAIKRCMKKIIDRFDCIPTKH